MPKITVRVPYRAEWEATINVPDEALTDIAGFLEDNPEYINDIEDGGYVVNEQLMLLETVIDS